MVYIGRMRLLNALECYNKHQIRNIDIRFKSQIYGLQDKLKEPQDG